MAGRHANGEGTIYRRKDGRYEGAAYLQTTSGTQKRVRVYGRTRNEAHEKLTAAKALAGQGVPFPDRAWRSGDYLDYWLENVVRQNRRPKTHELTVRLYLKPGVGSRPLRKLSVPIVQAFLNQKLDEGHSLRKVQVMRTVLSAALTRAMREELVSRNVARLAELATWERGEIHPWSADEAKQFLTAAQGDALYPAFVLLMLYGLRRGELLGLRWSDIDYDNGEIRVRRQLQRIDHELREGDVKTRAGRRDLPLVGLTREALAVQEVQQRSARNSAAESSDLLTRNMQDLAERRFAHMWNILAVRHRAEAQGVDLGQPGYDILAAYKARELLRDLLACARTGPDRHRISQRLFAFYDWCAHTGLPELERLARTIEQWWPAIEAFIHTRITNATRKASTASSNWSPATPTASATPPTNVYAYAASPPAEHADTSSPVKFGVRIEHPYPAVRRVLE